MPAWTACRPRAAPTASAHALCGSDALNRAVKHAASRTPTRLDWAKARLVEGDVAAAVARLKAGAGPELQVHGSANLIQTLLAADLVDELRLWIFPVVLGAGKRLFGDGTLPLSWRPRDSTAFDSGAILAAFARAGCVAPGELAG